MPEPKPTPIRDMLRKVCDEAEKDRGRAPWALKVSQALRDAYYVEHLETRRYIGTMNASIAEPHGRVVTKHVLACDGIPLLGYMDEVSRKNWDEDSYVALVKDDGSWETRLR